MHHIDRDIQESVYHIGCAGLLAVVLRPSSAPLKRRQSKHPRAASRRHLIDCLITDEKAEAIVEEVGRHGARATWMADGNLIVDGMFARLWDGVSWDGNFEGRLGGLMEEAPIIM